ncbi:hypothetical protein ACIA5D_47880 [Actinoplanes sp. NPDC051513]|uniref:hypothetical protein n=1 Tax=Actinoplanes sp. NPDC051513 TaxID=3363908 RepID=UPI0037B08BC3
MCLRDGGQLLQPNQSGPQHGGTGAYWALLGPGVTVRRIAYDVDAAAATFRSAAPDYPGLGQFIRESVITVPSDAVALAAFSR